MTYYEAEEQLLATLDRVARVVVIIMAAPLWIPIAIVVALLAVLWNAIVHLYAWMHTTTPVG